MKIILFLLIVSFLFLKSSAYIYDDRLKNLQTQINDVKNKVDEIVRNCKNDSSKNEKDFKSIESTFINGTAVDPQQNSSSTTKFFNDFKGKVLKFLHIKQNSTNKNAVKVKRCLTRTVGRNCERINENIASAEDLKVILAKFFKCLGTHGVNLDGNETSSTTLFDSEDLQTTTPESESEDDEKSNPRTEAFLRYLASSKHPVEEVGRPKYNKPDLKKTQAIIDNAKSSMWMSFEVEDDVAATPTTTTEEYEMVPELPILKRETKNVKRNGLFKGIINSASDFQYEVPNVPLNLEENEKHDEPIDEINKLAQKIDLKQQEDLMKFLDQLNEKPKEFKFNVDKYFMLAFENITKSGNDVKEENDQDGIINVGPKKYFEFDSGNKRKRHSKDQRIEKLKEQFVNQFRDHKHAERTEFKKIVEHIHDNHVDNSFLDKTFRLNDGSIKTSELVKPLHLVNHVKSPKEVKMDIELGEKIKEIEDEDFHTGNNERGNSQAEVDAPFYKTEVKSAWNDIEELFP